MALRNLEYTALLYRELERRGELGTPGTWPPVLPVVLYNGEARWTAELEMRELIAPVPSLLGPCQPSQRIHETTNRIYRSRLIQNGLYLDAPWLIPHPATFNSQDVLSRCHRRHGDTRHGRRSAMPARHLAEPPGARCYDGAHFGRSSPSNAEYPVRTALD